MKHEPLFFHLDLTRCEELDPLRPSGLTVISSRTCTIMLCENRAIQQVRCSFLGLCLKPLHSARTGCWLRKDLMITAAPEQSWLFKWESSYFVLIILIILLFRGFTTEGPQWHRRATSSEPLLPFQTPELCKCRRFRDLDITDFFTFIYTYNTRTHTLSSEWMRNCSWKQ